MISRLSLLSFYTCMYLIPAKKLGYSGTQHSLLVSHPEYNADSHTGSGVWWR